MYIYVVHTVTVDNAQGQKINVGGLTITDLDYVCDKFVLQTICHEIT